MRNLLRRPIVPWSLFAISLVANLVWMTAARSAGNTDAATDAATEGAAAATAGATSETANAVDGQAADAAAKPHAAKAAAKAAAAAVDAWTATRARLDSSPARTFQKAIPNEGDKVSAAWARLFVWDVDLRRQLSNGDEVAALWRIDDQGLPEVAAATLQVGKTGQSFHAYRFVAPGDDFASYWTAEGQEVPRRLVDGPLETYEQITSLLKDRPKHGGIDFKTPVGTEVHAPADGVVTRVNWNWSSNGNCVELRLHDGIIVKLLHLSKNNVAAGASIKKGQIVALTGNTGHSTAPHLHYQLERGGKVIDPIDYHQTTRRQLDEAAMATFARTVAAADAKLAGSDVAAR